MLIDLLVDVAALIEATITVEKVAVTAGRPAASDKCSAAYVWGSQIFDAPTGIQERGDTAGCLYRRAYLISYRIDICRSVSVEEASTLEQQAVAIDLYDKADAVWCALAHAAANGTLFDPPNLKSCEDVIIGPLVIGDPQGDRVSATGTIRVTDPCPPEGS